MKIPTVFWRESLEELNQMTFRPSQISKTDDVQKVPALRSTMIWVRGILMDLLLCPGAGDAEKQQGHWGHQKDA